MSESNRRSVYIIGIFGIGSLLIHMLVSTNYELHRDAYLYLAEADHLAWGYLSIPPLTPFVAHLWQQLVGSTVFAIRMIPAIIGMLCILVIGKIVWDLERQVWPLILACMAYLVSPAFLRSNTLFQPVSFDIFFWTLGSWAMIGLLRSKDQRWWLVLGIIFGFGFLNKYSIVFVALSFVIGLSLTKQRVLFRSHWLIFGAIAGFFIILPNLLWQFNHNWPVVHHIMELQNNQLVHVRKSDFLLMQLLMIFPALPVFFAGFFYVMSDQSMRDFRAMGVTFIILILLMLVLNGKPYYTLGLYPVFFAFGGLALTRYTRDALKWSRPVLAFVMILLLLPVLPISLPVLSHTNMIWYGKAISKKGMEDLLRWEDGTIHTLPQDYADMIGWKHLAEIVDSTWYSLSPEEQKNTRIYAENYGQAGAILYHTRGKQMPEPTSFSDNFLFWAPDSISPTTLIYVNDETTGIRKLFQEVTLAGYITDPNAREHGMQVYLCRKPTPEFPTFYSNKVRNLKASYQRNNH